MAHISKSTLRFLQDLKKNNNREWFLENKDRYQQARDNFEDFVNALIIEIALFDPSVAHQTAKSAVFRIYRDVRFSKDKSPYKTNFGAHITAAHKKADSRAGYYIHLEPGQSMLAGGAYMPQGDWLKAIRQEIDYNADELKAILSSARFKKYFGVMEGEKLKKAPKDYPKDHPEIELLKHKSFLAVNRCEDELVISDDFLQHAISTFKALWPFDQFLNRAVEV